MLDIVTKRFILFPQEIYTFPPSVIQPQEEILLIRFKQILFNFNYSEIQMETIEQLSLQCCH